MQRLRGNAVSFARHLLVLVTVSLPSSVWAHARFKANSQFTPPRNDSTGLKTAPCGEVPRTQNPKVYKPGEEITVEWEETINHPGYYIIRFSKENDAGFENNVLVEKFVDTQNNPVSSPSDYHQYSTKVKLPNITCTGCTLQLIQHMDDAPERPYFSCTDIQLVDPSNPGSNQGPDPQPEPTPTPANSGKQKPAKPQGLKLEKSK